MRGEVEVTVQDNLQHTDNLTVISSGYDKYPAYHFRQTLSESDYGRATTSDGSVKRCARNIILPYMTRLRSPMRLTCTTDVTGRERSRVSEQTRCAIFNYKPLKRRDQPFLLGQFRCPEATLTSLKHYSPWMSVTKSDYTNPGSNSNLSDVGNNSLDLQRKKPGRLNRSYTDLGLAQSTTDNGIKPQLTKPNVERLELSQAKTIANPTDPNDNKHASVSVSDQLEKRPAQNSSDKSSQVEKRVTIITPHKISNSMPVLNMDMLRMNITKPQNPTSLKKGKQVQETQRTIEPTYYNGYLPPEKSEELSETLRLRPSSEKAPINRSSQRIQLTPTSYHKPLIGDRSGFMRGDKQRIFRPHIGQIGQTNMQDTNGPRAGHFSAYRGSHDGSPPRQKKIHLLENIRYQIQHAPSGHRSSLYKAPTAIELYDIQRKKTMYIKNQAQERIKK